MPRYGVGRYARPQKRGAWKPLAPGRGLAWRPPSKLAASTQGPFPDALHPTPRDTKAGLRPDTKSHKKALRTALFPVPHSPFPIPLLCSRGADAPFCVPAKRGFRVLWKRRRCMASQTRAGARTVLARGCAVAAPLAASGGPPRQRLSWFARSAKSLGSVLQIMSDSVYREWGGNLRPGLRLPALTPSRFRGTDKFWSHPFQGQVCAARGNVV